MDMQASTSSVIAAAEPAPAASIHRVISLNIRQGGGPRAGALLRWLLAKRPDFVVLPEWRLNAAGAGIRSSLESEGFHVWGCAASASRTNGLLLASRSPFVPERLTPQGVKGELLVADCPGVLRIVAAYFPQGHHKAPFFDAILASAERSQHGPLLLIGDLNTGLNEEDVEGQGARFQCAGHFVDLARRGGLRDLWRMRHGQAREWTWRSARNGFRIDHAFGNAALLERFPALCCEYDHEPRDAQLSDHSAILLNLR